VNSYQRVMNTLAGAPTDRPPVFAVLGAYGARLTGADMRTLYSDAAAYVAGQQALQKEFGFDLVLSAFDYSALAEAFGGAVAWSANQAPNLKRPGVRNAADVFAMALPDPNKSARLPVILEVTRRLRDLYKGQVPIVSVLPGPCSLPMLILGIEQWMEMVLFEPETAQKLLEFTAPFYCAWAGALMDAGADCLVVTEGMASSTILPRDTFARQCLPHLRSIFAQISAPLVFHHSGAAIGHILDLLPGLEHLVGVAISSQDDLSEARRLLGPEPTLIGNLDNLTLPVVSAAEVHDLAMRCLRTAAPAGRYILCNAGADVPQATPPENLCAMQQAAAEFSAEMGCAQ